MAGPKFWQMFGQPAQEFDPHQEYVIHWTPRPPMIDAGKPRKTIVQGKSVRDTQKLIRDLEHGRVKSTELRRRGWFF